MTKVSDYIIQKLVEYGVKDVFMISGGGAMHLNDSVGKNQNIRYICNHHEQASAIAAEGYARLSGNLAVVIVTSGPGGTNTITGVIGQWLDSVPVLYLSGQVKQETTIDSCPGLGLRQLGDQEINIVDIVKPITKFAARITEPMMTNYLLEKAIYLATHGRPGPVWLDIPLDIQGASLTDPNSMMHFEPEIGKIHNQDKDLERKVLQTINLLKKAERPVLLAGHGIRISKSQQMFLGIISRLGIPVVSSMNGFDLVDSSNPYFIGRVGTIADRAGNFAVQNCDLLLSIGSRNNIRQIGYNWEAFAREAKKIVVDIDDAELEKPTMKIHLAIHADAGDFLTKLNYELKDHKLPSWTGWCNWCRVRKDRYPVVLPEYKETAELINPYYFMQELSRNLAEDAVVVAGNGTAFLAMFQAGIVKRGQRYIWNSGCASMGYDLPAAIGASIASGKDVVCLAGDGSIQMNLQELATIVHYKMPIKIFLLNNKGYCSIKQTQDTFFNGRRVACDSTSGVGFPDIAKISAAYDLSYLMLASHENMVDKIYDALDYKGPILCEVKLIPDYRFSPRSASQTKSDGRIVSKPLEDLFPFLDRDEFESNMIISSLREQD